MRSNQAEQNTEHALKCTGKQNTAIFFLKWKTVYKLIQNKNKKWHEKGILPGKPTCQSLWTVESCPLLMIKTHTIVWTVNTRNFKAWVEFWLWIGQWRMLFVQCILNSLFFPPHISPFFSHSMKHPTSALELESMSAKRMDCQQFFGNGLIGRPQLGEERVLVNSCQSQTRLQIHPETEWAGCAQER